jgi:hypothetical protein
VPTMAMTVIPMFRCAVSSLSAHGTLSRWKRERARPTLPANRPTAVTCQTHCKTIKETKKGVLAYGSRFVHSIGRPHHMPVQLGLSVVACFTPRSTKAPAVHKRPTQVLLCLSHFPVKKCLVAQDHDITSDSNQLALKNTSPSRLVR